MYAYYILNGLIMPAEESKYKEPYVVALRFRLSNHFKLNFTERGPTGFGSFLIQNCSGFRLLLPNSIVYQHANMQTGLERVWLYETLPVLCKMWAGTDGQKESHYETGIHDFEICGRNDAGNFSHYNAIHLDNSSEIFKYKKTGGLGQDQKYVENMHTRDVSLRRKKICLKSFWMTGYVTLPIEFTAMLTKLVADYPSTTIEISCTTTKIDFSNNYSESIDGEEYNVESQFIELDEASFRAEVIAGNDTQPLTREDYFINSERQDFASKKLSEDLSNKVLDISAIQQKSDIELETRIHKLEQNAQSLAEKLSLLVFLGIVSIAISIYMLNSS